MPRLTLLKGSRFVHWYVQFHLQEEQDRVEAPSFSSAFSQAVRAYRGVGFRWEPCSLARISPAEEANLHPFDVQFQTAPKDQERAIHVSKAVEIEAADRSSQTAAVLYNCSPLKDNAHHSVAAPCLCKRKLGPSVFDAHATSSAVARSSFVLAKDFAVRWQSELFLPWARTMDASACG